MRKRIEWWQALKARLREGRAKEEGGAKKGGA